LIRRKFATGGQGAVLGAALSIFGFADVPIVYFSIRIFRTQHPQPVIAGGENSGLEIHMLYAFLWNLLAFTILGLVIVWARYLVQRVDQAVEEAHKAAALRESAAGGAA
jgi:heme exporter protein C